MQVYLILRMTDKSTQILGVLLHVILSVLLLYFVILQESKRSSEELCGRSDGNVKVIFPKKDLPVQAGKPQRDSITPGDYVLVKVWLFNWLFLVIP